MLLEQQILQYSTQYLEAQTALKKPSGKGMGISMATILLHSYNYSSEEIPESFNQKDFCNGLKLAIAIDMKNILELDDTAKSILKSLKFQIEEKEVSENFYVGSLDEAISIIENHNISNQDKHVVRVLKAIKIAEQSTDEMLKEKDILKIDLPVEEGEEHRFYFHRENYNNIKERRDALHRLSSSIITIWNDTVENNELAFFLNSIQSGPCIEGATREPLANTAARLQTAHALPMPYLDAINAFYHQAASLLTVLRLPNTLNVTKQLILDAYKGSKCIPSKYPVNAFSDADLKASLLELRTFDSIYQPEKEAIVKISFPVDCAIEIRLNCLSAILPYTDPANHFEIKSSINSYKKLITVASPNKKINTTEYLGVLQKVGSNNTIIIGKYTVLACSLINKYHDLAEALLENQDIDLLSNCGIDDYTFLEWFIFQGQKVFLALLKQKKSFLSKITKEDFFKPVTTKSFYRGENQFESLLKTIPGGEILTLLLAEYSELFVGLSFKEIRAAKTENKSSLHWLVFDEVGLQIFDLILQKNHHLTAEITAKRLRKFRYLLWLSMSDKGIIILKKLLDKHPELIAEIKDEDICKTNNNGLSPFYYLARTKVFLRFLNNNRFHHLPITFFTNTIKIGKKPDTNNLSSLISTFHGQKTLLYLLDVGSTLLTQLDPDNLCLSFGQGFPLLSLANTVHGKEILSILFALHPTLLRAKITVTAFVNNRLLNVDNTIFSISPLAMLALDGCDLIDNLITSNSHFNITIENLINPIGLADRKESCLLYLLTTTDKGREILIKLFNKYPKLVNQINVEMLTRLCESIKLTLSADGVREPQAQEKFSSLKHILDSKNMNLILHLNKNPKLKSLFRNFIKENAPAPRVLAQSVIFQDELEASVNNLTLCIKDTYSIKQALLKIAQQKLKAISTREELFKVETYIKTNISSPVMSLLHRHRHEWFDRVRAKLFNLSEEDQHTRSYKTLLAMIENKKQVLEQSDNDEDNTNVNRCRIC
ncbi:MAG: hypothetical protein V4501_08420 [Pseudomonadota bacterium]